MALYKDVATILNALNAQARGVDAVEAVNLSGAIADIKTHIDSADYKDAFMNSLCTVISKYTNRYTSFRVKYPAINVTEEIFGGMAVKNDIAPFEAVANTATGVGASDYAPDFTAYQKPSVEQKFFIGFDKWAEKMKLPDDLLDTAFHSEAEAANFISAVQSAFFEAQIQHQNKAQDMCLINFLAELLYEGVTEVNIRKLYNEEFETNYDMDTFLHTQACHQYACMIIDRYKTYLTAPDGTAIFNLENKVRRSDPEDCVAFFLTDFVSAYKTYLLNGISILNNDLLKLGDFYEVAAWQATSVADLGKPNLGATSRIDVKTSAGHDVGVTGVIGAIIDKRAIATSQLQYKSAVDRWNGDGVTFYTQRARASYINDWSENAVVFTISDYSSGNESKKAKK